MKLRLLLALGAACGTSTPPSIRASDFDQTCTQNADCAAVEDDTPCCNICPNAAVSKAALAAFGAERMKQAAKCTTTDRMCAETACNTSDHAACSNGKCVFVRCAGTICPDRDASTD